MPRVLCWMMLWTLCVGCAADADNSPEDVIADQTTADTTPAPDTTAPDTGPECTTATECSGAETDCRVRACLDGKCGFADVPTNTPCTEGAASGTCDGLGACVPNASCTQSADCPGEDTQCRLRACVAGTCGFAEFPDGTPCLVGDVPGTCTQGECVIEAECETAIDCPGTDTECRIRSCTDGGCGFDNLDTSTACSVNGLGGNCDGSGGCNVTQQCLTAGDCPFESNPCKQAYCTSTGQCRTRNVDNSCQIGSSIGECRSGGCVCSTTNSNIELCNNVCVDTKNDINNCRFCGNRCTDPNEYCCGNCGGEECRCNDGFKRCEGLGSPCRDMRSNDNCGCCDKRCPPNSGCQSGVNYGCNGAGCACNSGFRRCQNPSSNTSLADHCVDPNSTQWSDAGCSDGGTATPLRL